MKIYFPRSPKSGLGRKRKCWPVSARSSLAMEEPPFREPVLDAKSEVRSAWEEKGLGVTVAWGRLVSELCFCFCSRSPAR